MARLTISNGFCIYPNVHSAVYTGNDDAIANSIKQRDGEALLSTDIFKGVKSYHAGPLKARRKLRLEYACRIFNPIEASLGMVNLIQATHEHLLQVCVVHAARHRFDLATNGSQLKNGRQPANEQHKHNGAKQYKKLIDIVVASQEIHYGFGQE